MKRIRYLLVLLCGLTALVHGKTTVRVGSSVFQFADGNKNEDGAIREYLLPNETFERWTQLVAVREFYKIDDSRGYIAAMAAEYQKRRPHMKFGLFQSTNGKEWVIDFLEYPDAESRSYVEWNVFKATKAKHGIVVYQYALREYATSADDNPMTRIGEIRKAHLKDVYSATYEESESPSGK